MAEIRQRKIVKPSPFLIGPCELCGARSSSIWQRNPFPDSEGCLCRCCHNDALDTLKHQPPGLPPGTMFPRRCTDAWVPVAAQDCTSRLHQLLGSSGGMSMLCREYADAAVPPGHEGERVRERRLFVTGGGSASALESLPQLRAALATYGPLPQRCQSAAAGGDPGGGTDDMPLQWGLRKARTKRAASSNVGGDDRSEPSPRAQERPAKRAKLAALTGLAGSRKAPAIVHGENEHLSTSGRCCKGEGDWRKERNRQSAKRSRAKRQAYIGKLEVELQQLQQENRILKALESNGGDGATCQQLRQELALLQMAMHHACAVFALGQGLEQGPNQPP